MDFSPQINKLKVSNVIKKINELFASQVNEKGLKLQIFNQIRKGFSDIVYQDESRVIQVLSNILTNAIQLSKSGIIILKTCSNLTNFGNQIVFKIKDQGIGIKCNQEKGRTYSYLDINEYDNQISNASDMTLSQQIVEKLGGQLHFNRRYKRFGSQQQNGTTVVLTLPDLSYNYSQMRQKQQNKVLTQSKKTEKLNKDQQSSTDYNITFLNEQTESPPQINIQTLDKQNISERLQTTKHHIFNEAPKHDYINKNQMSRFPKQSKVNKKELPRILLVDDNIFPLYFLQKNIMETYEYSCDVAYKSRDAIKMVQDRFEKSQPQYELILTDIFMKDLDGFKMSKIIKSMIMEYGYRQDAILIYAISSMIDNGIIDFKHKFGIEKLIKKPANISDLDEIFRQLYIPSISSLLSEQMNF